jgi:hypothetical protein
MRKINGLVFIRLVRGFLSIDSTHCNAFVAFTPTFDVILMIFSLFPSLSPQSIKDASEAEARKCEQKIF